MCIAESIRNRYSEISNVDYCVKNVPLSSNLKLDFRRTNSRVITLALSYLLKIY